MVRAEGDETNPGLCGEAVAEVKGQAVHLITLNGDARVLLMSFVPGNNASLPFGPCVGEGERDWVKQTDKKQKKSCCYS